MEVSVSMRRTLSNPEKIDDIDVSVVVSFYSLSLSLSLHGRTSVYSSHVLQKYKRYGRILLQGQEKRSLYNIYSI